MRLKRRKARLARAIERVRQIFQMFLLGGPVGIFYIARLAFLRWRMDRVSLYLDRERELHRHHVSALNHELNGLISTQQATNIAAGQFWRWCEKKAAEVQP